MVDPRLRCRSTGRGDIEATATDVVGGTETGVPASTIQRRSRHVDRDPGCSRTVPEDLGSAWRVADQPAGTASGCHRRHPALGLFRSEDGGESFSLIRSLWITRRERTVPRTGHPFGASRPHPRSGACRRNVDRQGLPHYHDRAAPGSSQRWDQHVRLPEPFPDTAVRAQILTRTSRNGCSPRTTTAYARRRRRRLDLDRGHRPPTSAPIINPAKKPDTVFVSRWSSTRRIRQGAAGCGGP
jgi:hypothetical protein